MFTMMPRQAQKQPTPRLHSSKAPFTQYNRLSNRFDNRVKCLYARYNRLSNPLSNGFDRRLYRVYSRLSNRLSNPFDSRFDNRLYRVTETGFKEYDILYLFTVAVSE